MRLRKFPSERASRPLRQRSGRSAIIRHGVKALAVLFVLLVIAIGGAAMFLLSGPTEVTAVRERIRGVLQANLGNEYEVSVGKAIVDVDPVLGLVIRVNDLEVLDDKKAVVAKVPSTLLAIDPVGIRN